MNNKPERLAPILDAQTLRRLLLSLISQAQSDMQRQGLIREDQALAPLSFGRSDEDIDAIAIDEATLGFDSLTRLELINSVNQFFQLSQSGAEDYLLLTPSIGRWIEVVSHHMQLQGAEQKFGFATSGSAGPVSVHVHPLTHLVAEIAALCDGPLKEVSPSARVVALVPPHHIYGFLFTCLLPAIQTVEVIDLHRKAPSALAREAKPCDLVIGTPFSWQMVADAGLQLPDGLHGVTSAGPSTTETWVRSGPGRPDSMTEIYGSTETGGIGSRKSHQAPFELLAHLSPSGAGITRIANPDVRLPLQDQLTWHCTRRFSLKGRIDHIVQIAGVNVSPSKVAALIADVPGVAEAVVRLSSVRLKGFVVPTQDVTDIAMLEKRIYSHLREHLPAPARPDALRFGATLPRNAMGKMCDWITQDTSPASDTNEPKQEKPNPVILIN